MLAVEQGAVCAVIPTNTPFDPLDHGFALLEPEAVSGAGSIQGQSVHTSQGQTFVTFMIPPGDYDIVALGVAGIADIQLDAMGYRECYDDEMLRRSAWFTESPYLDSRTNKEVTGAQYVSACRPWVGAWVGGDSLQPGLPAELQVTIPFIEPNQSVFGGNRSYASGQDIISRRGFELFPIYEAHKPGYVLPTSRDYEKPVLEATHANRDLLSPIRYVNMDLLLRNVELYKNSDARETEAAELWAALLDTVKDAIRTRGRAKGAGKIGSHSLLTPPPPRVAGTCLTQYGQGVALDYLADAYRWEPVGVIPAQSSSAVYNQNTLTAGSLNHTGTLTTSYPVPAKWASPQLRARFPALGVLEGGTQVARLGEYGQSPMLGFRITQNHRADAVSFYIRERSANP